MYVLYIYDKNRSLITQLFEIEELFIKQRINDVSTADFSISNSLGYSILKERNYISIQSLENGKERELFYGFIGSVEITTKQTKVRLFSEEYLLKKKIIFDDINFNNLPTKQVINDIINQINSREGGFISLFNCDITTTISREYRAGKTLFQILKDIAGEVYEFNFYKSVLYFSTSIGVDRTTGPGLVFFEYDVTSPESNNISNAKIEYSIENIYNYILADDGSDFNAESISEYGVLEKKFRGGKNENLLQKKDSIKELEIIPNISDFFVCDVGDTVKVYVNSGSELLSFNGSLKVVEKSFKGGELDTFSLRLSSGKVVSKNIIEVISDIKDSIQN